MKNNKKLNNPEYAAAYLEAIFEAVIDAVITIYENGLIETVNPAGEKLFGYTEDELLGRNVSVLMPSPHHEQHDQYLNN